MQQPLPHVLERLAINEDSWKTLTTEFEEHFQQWVGSEHIVAKVCKNRGYQRLPNREAHQILLSP